MEKKGMPLLKKYCSKIGRSVPLIEKTTKGVARVIGAKCPYNFHVKGDTPIPSKFIFQSRAGSCSNGCECAKCNIETAPIPNGDLAPTSETSVLIVDPQKLQAELPSFLKETYFQN